MAVLQARLALKFLWRLIKEELLRKLTARFLLKQMVQPLLRFKQPPLEPTTLVMKSPRRPARLVLQLKTNTTTEINLVMKFLSWLSKLSLQGVRNNSYEPSGMLIDDEDVELVVNK